MKKETAKALNEWQAALASIAPDEPEGETYATLRDILGIKAPGVLRREVRRMIDAGLAKPNGKKSNGERVFVLVKK